MTFIPSWPNYQTLFNGISSASNLVCQMKQVSAQNTFLINVPFSLAKIIMAGAHPKARARAIVREVCILSVLFFPYGRPIAIGVALAPELLQGIRAVQRTLFPSPPQEPPSAISHLMHNPKLKFVAQELDPKDPASARRLFRLPREAEIRLEDMKEMYGRMIKIYRRAKRGGWHGGRGSAPFQAFLDILLVKVPIAYKTLTNEDPPEVPRPYDDVD